jgi:hypothetical protein
MGNKNSIISVMFEEIKGLLKSIDKKLYERVSVMENHSSPGTDTVDYLFLVPEERINQAWRSNGFDKKRKQCCHTANFTSRHKPLFRIRTFTRTSNGFDPGKANW